MERIDHRNNFYDIIAPQTYDGLVATVMIRRAGRYQGDNLPRWLATEQARFYNGREGKTFFLENDDEFWRKTLIWENPIILLGIVPTEQILRWVYANRKNIFAWIGSQGGKMAIQNLPANLEAKVIFDPDKELAKLVGERLLGTMLVPKWAKKEETAANELKKLIYCNSFENILHAFVKDDSGSWESLKTTGISPEGAEISVDLNIIRGWAGRR